MFSKFVIQQEAGQIMIHVKNNPQYYINARALTFSENDLGDPNRVAVSLVSGTVVMVYKKGTIDYASDGSYEKWTLRGYSTKLVKNDKYYIYARLSRTDKTALIVFSVNSYNLDGSITTITGKDEEGNDITETTDPNENYFYVKIGELTETDGSSMRELTYDSGLLGTDKGKDEAGGWNEMWELSKLSTPWLIRAKQWLADFTVKGFIKLIGGLKFSKGQEGDEKPITDIKRSVDSDNEFILNEDGTQIKDPNYVPISDETIPTTKYLHSVTDERFLRKDKDDRSVGTISSDKGFEVGDYVPGELGIGGIFKIDENGDSYLEVDKALFRKIAYFVEIMIKKLSHVGGSIILSPASMKCSKVEEYETYYRCYFENEHEGKTINQEFVVGDQARSQEFNIKEGLSQNVSNQYYWRLVVGVGSNYIDLSKADCDSGSGIPLAGDDIVQLGNRDNPSRQRAIILSSYGEGTPSIIMYRGIKSYSMSDAKMPLRLSPDGNIIEGDFISKSGKNLEEWMSEVEVNWDKVLEQTDKEFTMWFFEYDPSPEVYPESEWFTDELRALHEQDLFYNTAKGMAWRYTLKDGVFFWELVTDADTLKALEDAAKAQQTADGAVQRLDSIVSDGKLSAVEKKEVRKEWASIVDTYEWNMYSSDKIGVDMQSQEVVGYTRAYNALSTYITPLLDEDGDSDINPDEYRGYWTDYYTTETKLRNFLSEKAKEKADDVEQQVNEISSDGVLSALEKKEVLKEWMSIVEEYRSNTETAQNFGMTTEDSSLNEYVNAYNALGSYMDGDEDGLDEDKWDGIRLPSWLADLSTNQTIVGDVYRSRWTAYYDSERVLLSRISVIAKDKADDAQEDADKANDELGEIASDNVLSKVEKKETLREWMEEFDAYYANIDNAEKYSVDTTDYEGKFYALAYYLNGNEAWDGYSIPLWLRDLTVNQEIIGSVFRQKWADYYNTKVSLLDAISTAIKSKADEAQQGVDDVNDRVDDIVSDGVLSSLEKKEVLKEWQAVVAQYTNNKNYADKYELDYSDYTDAYHALGTYLNNGITWNGSGTPLWLGTQIGVNTTLSSPTDYRKAWVDYYKAESILIERISEAGLGTRVQNFKTYPNELPVPPYNVGDRWMNAYYTVGGVTYAENDDMVCVQAKAKNEVASINDWEFSSSMNSDTKKDIEASIKNLGDSIELEVSDREGAISELKVKTNSIEQSIINTQGGVEEAKELASTARSLAITASMTGMYSGEEYNQTTNPWQNWSSGTEYKHVGAIWYNPNTGVTKRYIGTDGTNSWETVDDNVYSSATFVFQNKSKWSVVAANFNDDGSVKGNSGIVTTSSYAALFSEQWNENESVRAEIGTFVTKNADGTLDSNVKITADNIKLEGVTTINGSFSVDTDGTTHIGGFTVYDGKMTSDGDYKMTIDPVSNNPSISISFADHTYATMRVSNVSPYSGQLELYGAMGAISLLNGGFAKFENSSGAEGITIEGDSKLGPSLTIRKGSYYVSIGINSDNMAVIASNCWPYYDDSTTRKQGTLSWDNSRYGKFK